MGENLKTPVTRFDVHVMQQRRASFFYYLFMQLPV